MVESVRLDDAWSLVEEYATLVRESGTDAEREAVGRITTRLDAWNVPYTLHEPELLISLPRSAALTVGGRAYVAKTPSMARSTGPRGETAPIVYEPTGFAQDVNDIFSGAHGTGDVTGKFVLTEGFPMPGKVADLEARGAQGIVFIAPGERIHEGICTSIWGSPDLTSYGRRPRIPVVSVSNPDGARLIDQLAGGDMSATIATDHEEGFRRIPVLVAELTGTVEPERFVLLHGHLDSWHEGIGDNATGNATLLEVARVLGEHRGALKRTVRIAWWSGHSHGRYAGSTWYADTFALDLARNCICHINCDSPGCKDADVFEDVYWMAEVEEFAKDAIRDFTGQGSEGRHPLRAGDISFNNLGLSTFFMLSSTMPAPLRKEKSYYAVGGCGGNIEWHTEADTLDIADRDRLLRDIRLYAGSTFRAANVPVHPLDFRATVTQIEEALGSIGERAVELVDPTGSLERAQALRSALEALYAAADKADSVEAARPFNDALLKIGRALVRVLYSASGTYRQDPALDIPLLPELAAAADAVGTVPDGVL
ncbi:MAG TPA: M28 family peptidase, partial [Gaiellaceae bacterium]|nr:M28 family peptidase [Gaiellaceae bacterium]